MTKNIRTHMPLLLLLLLIHSPAISGKTGTKGLNLLRLTDMQLFRQGDRLIQTEKADSALLCFELLNRRNTSDKQLYASSLYKAGRLYYERDSYSKAMECYMKALRFCQEQGLENLQPLLYKDIGNIYSMFNDYEQGSSLYTKALEIARRQGDREFVNMLLSNLICAYTPKTPIKTYWQYYDEISKNREKRPRYNFDLLFDKGVILKYEDKNSEAIEYFHRAARYSTANRLTIVCLASCYSSLSSAFQSLGKRDSALFYLNKNKEIAIQTGQTSLLISTLRNLSRLYHGINEPLSLEYKAQYLSLSDSIFNLNEFNGIRNTLFYYEMDNNQKTISSLNQTNRAQTEEIAQQRRWLITLVAFIAIVLLLVAVAYIQYRRLRHAYHDLFDRSQEQLAADNLHALRIKELEHRIATMKAEQTQPSAPAGIPSAPLPTTEQTQPERPKDEAGATSPLPDPMRMPLKLSEEHQTQLLNSILQVMEQTEVYCESDFTIDRLATLVNSNSRYVSQIINDVFSKNFRTFLNEFRVKKAMIRMNDTEHYGNYTIKAIAESVGYKSQSNFINVFTRQTGIKPSVFQKLSKERRTVGE